MCRILPLYFSTDCRGVCVRIHYNHTVSTDKKMKSIRTYVAGFGISVRACNSSHKNCPMNVDQDKNVQTNPFNHYLEITIVISETEIVQYDVRTYEQYMYLLLQRKLFHLVSAFPSNIPDFASNRKREFAFASLKRFSKIYKIYVHVCQDHHACMHIPCMYESRKMCLYFSAVLSSSTQGR